MLFAQCTCHVVAQNFHCILCILFRCVYVTQGSHCHSYMTEPEKISKLVKPVTKGSFLGDHLRFFFLVPVLFSFRLNLWEKKQPKIMSLEKEDTRKAEKR